MSKDERCISRSPMCRYGNAIASHIFVDVALLSGLVWAAAFDFMQYTCKSWPDFGMTQKPLSLPADTGVPIWLKVISPSLGKLKFLPLAKGVTWDIGLQNMRQL